MGKGFEKFSSLENKNSISRVACRRKVNKLTNNSSLMESFLKYLSRGATK